jgi:hypothetical protein
MRERKQNCKRTLTLYMYVYVFSVRVSVSVGKSEHFYVLYRVHIRKLCTRNFHFFSLFLILNSVMVRVAIMNRRILFLGSLKTQLLTSFLLKKLKLKQNRSVAKDSQ